jgi:hypothetical protein
MALGPARVVVFLAMLLAASLGVPAAGGATGEIRVLYVLATWGPTPFTRDHLEQVAVGTDAFFRASSSGRVSMPGSVTGPTLLPRPVFDSCDATAIRSESPASAFAGHNRVVFVTPLVQACRFSGKAESTEVLLNGRLEVLLAVHELGHTLGLDHANSWYCIALGCTVDEYGSAFSPMGSGGGDFNAYEKAELGWLNAIDRPGGDATHVIGPIEGPTTLPQALVVTTATSEFWLESRGRPTPSFTGDSEQPAGVAVIAGPAPDARSSPYPAANLLLPHPSGEGRFAYTAGESFVQPDVFRVTIERHAQESATLRFEWLDRVAPAAPRVVARAVGRRSISVSWQQPRERGSGVDTYSVLADGRVAHVVRSAAGTSTSLRLARGAHRIAVFATDRAGNRGLATSVRVRVR